MCVCVCVHLLIFGPDEHDIDFWNTPRKQDLLADRGHTKTNPLMRAWEAKENKAKPAQASSAATGRHPVDRANGGGKQRTGNWATEIGGWEQSRRPVIDHLGGRITKLTSCSILFNPTPQLIPAPHLAAGLALSPASPLPLSPQTNGATERNPPQRSSISRRKRHRENEEEDEKEKVKRNRQIFLFPFLLFFLFFAYYAQYDEDYFDEIWTSYITKLFSLGLLASVY